MTIKILDNVIIDIANTSRSMAEAASSLGLHFNTFKVHAKRLGVYTTNQSGRGIKKPKRECKISLNDILVGKHPSYQTFKLKKRLISEGIKQNKCEVCGITAWQGSMIKCELDHIDGNRNNHLLSNLRIICPNCHSQTDTFRAKNIKN